jgi:CDP-diacylglycerol---glycerol-3-phosphate 3-phosphatidyltransferase
MNVPNALSLLRVALAPIVFFTVYKNGNLVIFGLLLFILGSFSDWLDGYFARKHEQITGFGQFLDPIADKLLAWLAMLSVAFAGYTAIWAIIGIIVRDVLVTSFRLWGLHKNVKILPSKLAKAKTALEMFVVIGIMIYMLVDRTPDDVWVCSIGLAVVFVLAWITAIDYFWKNRELIA